ncbi:MAG: UPF0104 family protein [Spirosomaceae bacterium]|nr:UPF0104 family protein [Spirosomataceae bacterium]
MVKFTLLAAMMWYLYVTLQAKNQSLLDVWTLLQQQISTIHGVELVLVVFLTPLNWAFEARKWQVLAQKIESITFWQSLKGVLAGLALGFFMPNNVGDAAGRVLSLQSRARLTGVGAALLSNGLQFYVSLLFGTLGWGYLLWQQPSLQKAWNWVLLGLLVATLLFGIWLVSKRQNVEKYLEQFGWFRWIEPYVDVIAHYRLSEIRRAFRWALGRYAVFTGQFVLLLYVFEVNLNTAQTLSSVFLVFFAKTLIPALNFLGDLGIREASSMYFFSFYAVSLSHIVATTLTLWCVNILLPVLVGIGWLMQMKWVGRNKEERNKE